ncbi:hypothetical protein niasHS_016640 [Heterodera schachtii]|uniref:Uncharacterized protein n=1 Tax=Heterodera schachtii TaxID=97005 RepID=A0ABD2HRJ1_HETSC
MGSRTIRQWSIRQQVDNPSVDNPSIFNHCSKKFTDELSTDGLSTDGLSITDGLSYTDGLSTDGLTTDELTTDELSTDGLSGPHEFCGRHGGRPIWRFASGAGIAHATARPTEGRANHRIGTDDAHRQGTDRAGDKATTMLTKYRQWWTKDTHSTNFFIRAFVFACAIC